MLVVLIPVVKEISVVRDLCRNVIIAQILCLPLEARWIVSRGVFCWSMFLIAEIDKFPSRITPSSNMQLTINKPVKLKWKH